MARKPLVLRDRITKVLIPYYVKGEDVLLNDGTYLEAKLADIIGMIGTGGYTPPPTGIPADDLAGNIPLSKLSTTVQQLLALANTALQEQVQADWEEENSSSPAFIQHKPEIPEGVEVSQSVQQGDTRAVAGGAVYNELQGKASATTVALLRESLDAITGGDTTTAIRTFNEIITFLANIEDTETLEGIIAGLQTEINKKYTKPQAGIPASDLEGNIPVGKLSQDVQTSLGKANTALQQSDKTSLQGAIDAVQTALNNLIGSGNVQGAIDTFNEVKAFLAGISANDPNLFNQLKSLSDAITALQTALASKQDVINDLVTIRSGATAGATALQQNDVSVESQGDGTVVINVGSGANKDTYTINLNHTHEGMAKLVVCEESDLPSTLDMDTIYAQVDDASDPTEIQSLWIAGLEFVGGGGASDEPRLISPRGGLEINFDGETSKPLSVRGKNLSEGLSLTIDGDFTVTVNGSSVSSISATDANAGVLLTLTKGSNYLSGTLRIHSSEVEVTVRLLRDITLPAGYTALEYVIPSSTRLDTNILSTGSSWRIKAKAIDSSTTQIAICTGGSAGGQYFGIVLSQNEDGYYWGLTPLTYFEDVGLSEIIEVVIVFGSNTTATIGNNTITRPDTTQTNKGIELFGCSNGNPYYYTGRIYEVECLNGGSFHAYPAQRNSDGVVGLYDIENNVFYTGNYSKS